MSDNNNITPFPGHSAEGETPLGERIIERFFELGREMVKNGVNEDFVIGGLLSAAMSAAENAHGKTVAAGWFREIADSMDGQLKGPGD